MLQRCYNRQHRDYRYYGGAGVSVCDRWRTSFATFLSDMGTAPSAVHSIDRFPNGDGSYEPGNVRWATPAEQMRNTSRNRWVTFRDKTLCVTDWATETGLPKTTIQSRLEAGWSIEDSLTTPSEPSPDTVAALARQHGLKKGTLHSRLAAGWPLSRALATPARKKRSPLASTATTGQNDSDSPGAYPGLEGAGEHHGNQQERCQSWPIGSVSKTDVMPAHQAESSQPSQTQPD